MNATSSASTPPGVAPSPDFELLGRIGHALADDSRRRLLVLLLEGGWYASDLANAAGLSRTNASNHLSCLRGCGLVIGTREGRRVRYSIADPGLADALTALCQLDLGPAKICQGGLVEVSQ